MTYERPEILDGETHSVRVGCGKLYVTLNTKKDERFNDPPLNEIWINPAFKDKEALYCCKTFLISMSRLLTFIIRRIDKEDREALLKQLRQHECPKKIAGTSKSCVDAVGSVLTCYWDGCKIKNGRCWVCGAKE